MSTSNPPSDRPYFDLRITGIGYLSRVREVQRTEEGTFLSVTVSALWGHVDAARYTRFDCTVSGVKTQALVRQLQDPVEAGRKVLIGFTLSDLSAESFTFQKGEQLGEIGVSLKSRLLGITWVRVDGEPFYSLRTASPASEEKPAIDLPF